MTTTRLCTRAEGRLVTRYPSTWRTQVFIDAPERWPSCDSHKRGSVDGLLTANAPGVGFSDSDSTPARGLAGPQADPLPAREGATRASASERNTLGQFGINNLDIQPLAPIIAGHWT